MNKPIKNVWAVLPRKAGNGIYKLESCKKLKEKKLEKDMAEMFGHSFDQQMIRDVIISHDYDGEKRTCFIFYTMYILMDNLLGLALK